MFITHTLPWFYKGSILFYDVMLSMLYQRADYASDPSASGEVSSSMYKVMFKIFFLFLLLSSVALAPSLFLSVYSREKTSKFISEVLMLLSAQTLLVIAVHHELLACEIVCYCLQFTLCYTAYCVTRALQQDSRLLAGNTIVKHTAFLSMHLFPLIFSHALNRGMHLSPYILAILFGGEVLGVLCMSFIYVMNMVIHGVGALISSHY
jgi:hypothetical protein